MSKFQLRNKTSKINLKRQKTALINDQYSILVSCRCNYTGRLFSHLGLLLCYIRSIKVLIIIFFSLNLASRLFFKQPTSWRPRSSRDIMISIMSDTSRQSPSACEKTCQPPVQVNIWLTIFQINLCFHDSSFIFVLLFSGRNYPYNLLYCHYPPSQLIYYLI